MYHFRGVEFMLGVGTKEYRSEIYTLKELGLEDGTCFESTDRLEWILAEECERRNNGNGRCFYSLRS